MRLYNYISSRHDIFQYDNAGPPQNPILFNPEFYLSAYSPYLSCLNIRPRWDGIPHSDGPARATLISPLHVLGTKDNAFDVGDTFTFYNHTFTTSFSRTIYSKTSVGESLVLGELDEAIHEDEVIPSRLILSNDGDIDYGLIEKTILIVGQDDRVGIREISDVDSDKIYHVAPSSVPEGYLVDDKISDFLPGDETCPVFYPDDQGRMVLLGLLNATGTHFEFLSRHGAQINDIIDSYGYSLNYVNPFESVGELTPDTTVINVVKRVYWHIATSTNIIGELPADYNPDSDPVGEPGISTLVTYGDHSVSVNYLANDGVYAIDRLCLFPQNVSIPVHTGNYDISPGYFIFQTNHDNLMKIFQYPGESQTPVDINEPVDIDGSFCVLSYMLFGAYADAADSCLDPDVPDSFFDHLDSIHPAIAKTPADAEKIVDKIKPHQDVFSDGNDAGFYFKMQEIQEIDKVGCCDVIIGGPDCDYNPYPGINGKWTRIWMVRQWVNTWFDTRKDDADYPPLAAELLYADLDESLDSPNWVHAGFITFEDQSPYQYDGLTVPENFNGNLKDHRSGFNIDIQDISWDNKGRLWALCSGGFDDAGDIDADKYVKTNTINTVEGIYQLLPGGKSKRTRRDGVEIDIFFPARLLRRERIKNTYASPMDIPYVWAIRPEDDAYFAGDQYANSINNPSVGYTFSDISSIIVEVDGENPSMSGYLFGKIPLYVKYEDDLNDATIRVMEWHWRPYKDREPKYRIDKNSVPDFDDYDSSSLDQEDFACFSDGTMQNARPRRFRNFLDASGVLVDGTGIQTDEIYNEQEANTSGYVQYITYESDPGVRGVYTYEAPLVSEYIRYTDATDGTGADLWDKYLNDNFMQFNFIDSHPESKRFRLRTSWESKIWRKRETLPRDIILDAEDPETVYSPGTAAYKINTTDSPESVTQADAQNPGWWMRDTYMGFSIAMDQGLVVIGEPYGSLADEIFQQDPNQWDPGGYYGRAVWNGCVTTWDMSASGEFSWDYEDAINRIYPLDASGDDVNGFEDRDRFGACVAVTKGAWQAQDLSLIHI